MFGIPGSFRFCFINQNLDKVSQSFSTSFKIVRSFSPGLFESKSNHVRQFFRWSSSKSVGTTIKVRGGESSEVPSSVW